MRQLATALPQNKCENSLQCGSMASDILLDNNTPDIWMSLVMFKHEVQTHSNHF